MRTLGIWCAVLLIMISGTQGLTLPVEGSPSMVKVLTLDDRPPNFLMLKQLGAIAGVYVDIDVGDSIPSGVPVDLTDYDLISLNAAVAGSLVGSRTADPRDLLPPYVEPHSLIHFAVPRCQPTVTDSSLKAEYDRVLGTLEKPETQRRVAAVIAGRTDSTGDEFLDAYSKRLLGWLDFLDRAQLDPDRLLITLDDNRPGPLADTLKLKLGEYSHHVMDGTDEGMMLLFARYLREHQPDAPTTLGLMWTAPGDLVSIAPFESALVVENLLAELNWLKARVTSRLDTLQPWHTVLWVNGAGENDDKRRGLLLKDTISELGERQVVVADITRVNSGDPVLMDVWRDDGPPPGLVGYLAWNTSSNTLGSAVALWVTLDYGYTVRSDPWSVQAAAEAFLWARLIDDWLYQSITRQEVRDEYILLGANPWSMTEDEAHRAAADIAARLVELWREIGIDMSIPLSIVQPLSETGFVIELPWNRFFEINLYPTDNRGWVPQITPSTINE